MLLYLVLAVITYRVYLPRPPLLNTQHNRVCHISSRRACLPTLQELVSKKDQPTLRVDPEKFESHLDFVHAAAFSAAFKRSEIFRGTRALLDKPFDKREGHPAALMTSTYGVTGWDAVKALVWRERMLLTRDKQAQIYRYVQMAVLAIMASTLFLRGEVTTIDTNDVRVRALCFRCLIRTLCPTHYSAYQLQ